MIAIPIHNLFCTTNSVHMVIIGNEKFNEIALFVIRKFRSKSLKLSRELSRELLRKVHKNKERNSRILLALLLDNTVNQG